MAATGFSPSPVGELDSAALAALAAEIINRTDAEEDISTAVQANSDAITGEISTRVAATNALSARATALETSRALAADLTAEILRAETEEAKALPKAGGTMSGPLTLSGDPTNALHAATKQYVLAVRDALVNGAPGLLDTLGELAAQLAVDESAAAAITTALANEVTRATNAENARAPRPNVRVITGPAVTAVDGDVLLIDTTANPCTVTMPTATAGALVTIKKTDATSANPITINATVDTAVNPTITVQNSSISMVADGNNWKRTVRPVMGAIADVVTTGATDLQFLVYNSTSKQWVLSTPALLKTGGAMSGAFVETPVALTDAATIVVDASTGNVFKVTLGGNRTLANPTNPQGGQRILFRLRQDATGGRTITWDTKYRFSDDLPTVTLSTAASKLDRVMFEYNIDDDKWDCVGAIKGF